MPINQSILKLLATFTVACIAVSSQAADARKPNIIFILADDIGYGDIGCYGATKVLTPNLDKLAADGLRFTDGHCTSGSCTPSRYSLMTGTYAWRKKGTGILPGDAAIILEPGTVTLPAMFKEHGYTTAAVGKWHLGLGRGKLDWNADIEPGPLEVGFGSCFIIPATGDRVPTVFIRDHRVVGFDPKDPIAVSYGIKIGNEPTGKENPDQLKVKLNQGHDNTIVNGISRIGFMTGGKSARWTDEDIADNLTREATTFIETNKDKPFFLYFATHDIHVPRVPHARFKGTSQCGVRGDVIQELDWSVGEVMKKLKDLKLEENTLVIFSSDNGPVLDDGYADGAVKDLNGHTPAGVLRGGKYTPYEGGTRVPFIARWTGRIKPGTSDALVCQIDFIKSFAALDGIKLAQSVAPDSMNILPALLGESSTGRETLIEQGGLPLDLAVRQGHWKLVSHLNKPVNAKVKMELFDLSKDIGEKINLADKNPEKVKELTELLQKTRENGAN